MNKYYIAYGSNLNKRQMKMRCPTAKVVGNGYLYDYGLVFRVYATIEPSVGDKVPVTVWEIDEPCEQSLDRYEGYPRLYDKEHMDVEVDGKIYRAMVYIMNEEVREYSFPHSQYMYVVKEGYEDMGLDTKYLSAALQRTKNALE